jgi:hypothetical protein
MNLKALPLVVVLFISSVFQLMAQPLLTLQPGDEQPNQQRLIWSTEPGIRYELQESMDVDDPDGWTAVAGYPTEAEALSQQALIELDAPGSCFLVVTI